MVHGLRLDGWKGRWMSRPGLLEKRLKPQLLLLPIVLVQLQVTVLRVE